MVILVLLAEPLLLRSMLGLIRTVEQKKFDVSDAVVRQKFTPLK